MSRSEGTPLLQASRADGIGRASVSRTDGSEGNGFSTLPDTRRRGRRLRGAAIAGALMFAMAGAGLVAIFNAIQSASSDTTQGSTLNLLEQSGENVPHVEGADMPLNEGMGASGSSEAGSVSRMPQHGKEGRNIEHSRGHTATENKDAAHSRPNDVSSFHRTQNGAMAHEERVEQGAEHTVATSAGGNHPGVSLNWKDTGGAEDGTGGSSMLKPNVFFIMIDDMGWNDIGYQSTDLFELTPNLDRLAAEGVKVRSALLSLSRNTCMF